MPTSAVSPQAWCSLILTRCGLTFRGTQVPGVVATVRDHIREHQIENEAAYFTRLAKEPDGSAEWSALVERLLNHETSFFRHPPSFELLRAQVLPELRESAPGRRLNFWSAGCSTGQEAYSLAMLALAAADRDQHSGDFTVWGGDISREAIGLARRGRYNSRAIAGIPPAYRERFLRPATQGIATEYDVVDEVRRRVRFTTVNLLAARDVSLNHDVIFCHNVLIYFAANVASQVVAGLAQRLTLGGYLFLGPGEGPSERPPGLEPVAMNGVRAFRRKAQWVAEVRP